MLGQINLAHSASRLNRPRPRNLIADRRQPFQSAQRLACLPPLFQKRLDCALDWPGLAKPNDRANLRHGLPAHIRLGAYDYATFGTLNGKVSDVSADTLLDEREGRYYRIMLEAKDNNQEMEILPGMTAIADIVVGKRTVISYLLSPLLRFSDRALRDPR